MTEWDFREEFSRNRLRKSSKVFLIVVCSAAMLVCARCAYADWQSDLEAVFDRVETFDGFDDFKPTTGVDCLTQEHSSPLPSGTAGTGLVLGRWNYLGDTPSARNNFIGPFSGGKSVGTKSLIVGYEGNGEDSCYADGTTTYPGSMGPSQVRIFFGDTGHPDGDSGYDECYIFFRMYLPKNNIPTNEEDLGTDLFKYVEGNPYLNTLTVGAKMVAFLSGFCSATTWHDPVTDTCVSADLAYRYGDGENWLYMGSYPDATQGNARYLLGARVTTRNAAGNIDAYNYPNANQFTAIDDQMGAVEIHVKLEDDGYIGGAAEGGGNGILEIWFYQSDGTCLNSGSPVISQSNLVFRSAVGQEDHKFNELMIHGNHRTTNEAGTGDYYYHCGDGMECGWWIDDLIVDDARIGTTYFNLLDGYVTCYPDVDGDLYPGSGSETVETCSTNYYESSHFTAMTEDCNDNNSSINPGATDLCGNSIDEDCSGADLECSSTSIRSGKLVDCKTIQ